MESSRQTPNRALARLSRSVAEILNSIIDKVFGLSLFLCVMVTGILLVLPVIGTWAVFAIAQFLPFPLGAIMIWGMAFVLVAFAAATDYARSA